MPGRFVTGAMLFQEPYKTCSFNAAQLQICVPTHKIQHCIDGVEIRYMEF